MPGKANDPLGLGFGVAWHDGAEAGKSMGLAVVVKLAWEV